MFVFYKIYVIKKFLQISGMERIEISKADVFTPNIRTHIDCLERIVENESVTLHHILHAIPKVYTELATIHENTQK